MDPISLALREASSPIDMELPEGWFWVRNNLIQGYVLRYRRSSYFFRLFSREFFFDNDRDLIRQTVYAFIQEASAKYIRYSNDARPNL